MMNWQGCTHGEAEMETTVLGGVEVSPTIEIMRDALKNHTKYRNSYKWINRVNQMPDNQVIAVYMRMKRAGEITV